MREPGVMNNWLCHAPKYFLIVWRVDRLEYKEEEEEEKRVLPEANKHSTTCASGAPLPLLAIPSPQQQRSSRENWKKKKNKFLMDGFSLLRAPVSPAAAAGQKYKEIKGFARRSVRAARYDPLGASAASAVAAGGSRARER